jgi:hypothetical protein
LTPKQRWKSTARRIEQARGIDDKSDTGKIERFGGRKRRSFSARGGEKSSAARRENLGREALPRGQCPCNF